MQKSIVIRHTWPGNIIPSNRLDAVGLNALAERFKDWGAVQAVERLNLDGLLALWLPPGVN